MPTSTKGAVSVKLTAITVDPQVQIRRSNREDIIRRLEEADWSQMEPIVLFQLVGGQQLLADGFHRVAAATRLGLTEISAVIRNGTRDEALEFAVIANVRHGKDLTDDEMADAVKRLAQLHPPPSRNASPVDGEWTQEKIAAMLGRTPMYVSRVLRVQDIRRKVVSKAVSRMSDGVLIEVAPAHEDHWALLIEAAETRGWKGDGLREAVKNLADPEIPDEHKAKLLAGKADPKVKTADGSLKTPVNLIKTQRTKATEDPVGEDVAERLHPIRVEMTIHYQWQSDRMRTRGLKDYPREQEHIERPLKFGFAAEIADPKDPDAAAIQVLSPEGLVPMLTSVLRQAVKKLQRQGWPVQEFFEEDDRPGVAT